MGLVLLLAVANVATLMLVRTSAREHELSVRSALGAGRHRLARLIVTEALVLTALGGLVGLGLAALSLRVVGSWLRIFHASRRWPSTSGSLAFAGLAALLCRRAHLAGAAFVRARERFVRRLILAQPPRPRAAARGGGPT